MADDAAALRERLLGWPPDEGDARELLVIADHLLERGDRALAATALDRAYGLAPDDAQIAHLRGALLDELAVDEHGLRWRYVPAGTFRMGARDGDPDERPTRLVRTGAYWLTDVPVTWAAYRRMMGWPSPNDWDAEVPGGNFLLYEGDKIRRSYCGGPDDENPTYDERPVVAVSYHDAEELGERLSTAEALIRLPTEAEWEKGARGGLVDKRYPWGDAPADRTRCDCGHFGEWSIARSRSYRPNGYGLYAMSGGVAEWTADWYDALAYRRADGQAAPSPALVERVIRGGSWADTPEACTVSFRASLAGESWRDDGGFGPHMTPTVGFRLCRVARV